MINKSELREMILNGFSFEEIRKYLTSAYGEISRTRLAHTIEKIGAEIRQNASVDHEYSRGETLLRLQKPVRYQMRYLGKAQVKGREHPISLYEIYEGAPESVRARRQQTKADFERGLKAYVGGKFTEAVTSFQTVLSQDPDDKTAALYLERATAMLGQPVPDNWDGVEVMTSK